MYDCNINYINYIYSNYIYSKLLIKYKKVKKELRQSNKNRKGLEQNIKEYQHSNAVMNDIIQQIENLFYVSTLNDTNDKIIYIYEFLQKLKNRL